MNLLFPQDALSITVALIFVIITMTYFYIKYLYNYWNRRGVKFLAPIFPFGNYRPVFVMKKSLGEQTMALYNQTKAPFIGIFTLLKPILLVRDPELCRQIIIRDFQHFHDRGVYVNEKHDPLSGHLFNLAGEKWKNLRAKLTPTFTSGKLKMMFPTLVDCGDNLNSYLSKVADNGVPIEMRDVVARFTTDIIASVAFGIDVNSIQNPDEIFRKMGRKVFASNMRNALRMAINLTVPKITEKFLIKSVDKDVEDFMLSVVKQTMEHREQNNIQRKDFMQLLLQLRNTGKVDYGEEWNVDTVEDNLKKLSLPEVTAQAFVFFLAGFETSSTTMSFCLFELARNSDIQRKIQQEIVDVLKCHGNKLTYDAIMEMKYLEMCIDETLRKYPPVPILNRECTKEYIIPGTKTVIEKGTSVFVPVLALQRDPQYYPEPNKFIPERFNNQSKNEEKPFTFMPFGDGPRNCIGLRLGKMQTKVGLVAMLSKFHFSLVNNKHDRELIMNPKSVIMCPLNGLVLRVSHRK